LDVFCRELQINKYKYCMAKDDVVIGLGRPLFGSSAYNSRKKAYPSVITTLAQMDPKVMQFIAIKNFLVESHDQLGMIKTKFYKYVEKKDGLKDDDPKMKTIHKQIDNMLDFYVVGISLGTAWAHPSSGDTVASVMIGGLRTVVVGGPLSNSCRYSVYSLTVYMHGAEWTLSNPHQRPSLHLL
jgi:hypothetical protein